MADPREDQDAADIRRVLAGDQGAFAGLVERHARRVHDLARRMLRDAHAAEDVAQHAFLNAYRALPRFDLHRPFRHWLLRITTNLCRNRLAKRRRRPLAAPGGESDEAAFDPAAPSPDLAAPSDVRIDAERLRDAIERLPDSYRVAVVLHYTQGLSLEEVSEITEVPVATVKTHLHRARAALARLLAPPDGGSETSAAGGGTNGR